MSTFLIVVGLIILAYVLGWQWGDSISAAIWSGLKWIGNKIKELFKRIFSKKEK